MRLRFRKSARRAGTDLKREEGQSILFVCICMLAFIGMIGLTIDVGQLYVTQRHLQTATDATALAAAADLPNGTAALLDACTYSATPKTVGSTVGLCPSNGNGGTSSNTIANGDNQNGSLGNVATQAYLECLSLATAGTNCQTGTGCTTQIGPSGTGTNLGCNAIKIVESTTVTPWVMGALGVGGRTVSATSTASASGGKATPLDIEVILDSTASMASSDNCGSPSGTSGVTGIPYGDVTAEDCAKAGMRALLEELDPCNPNDTGSATSCGAASGASGTNVADPEDEVGLMTVPPPSNLLGNTDPAYVPTSAGGIPDEHDCIKELVSSGSTIYFDTSPSNYNPAQSPNYVVVPLSSDYKPSNASTPANDSLLNPSSNLVNSVYWGDCAGGTYPANSGSGLGTSISKLGTSTAATAAIGGGPATAANLSEVDNMSSTGISLASSSIKSNTTGIGGGAGSSGGTSTPSTVAAGITEGSSKPFAGTSGATSITFPSVPSGTVTNDILIATVSVKSLTGFICPGSGWTELGGATATHSAGGTAIEQATFWAKKTAAAPSSLKFSFFAASTCSGTTAAATGTPTGIITDFSNVNTTSPIETSGLSTSGASSTSTTISAPTVSTTTWGDEIVHLYATNSTTITSASTKFQQNGGASSGVDEDGTEAAGTSTSGSATSGTAGNWIGQTIALAPAMGANLILTPPTGKTTGDLFLATVSARGLGSTGAICTPTGWTAVGSSVDSGTGGNTVVQATFRRAYVSTDTTYTFTFKTTAAGSCPGSASAFANGMVVRYSGVSTTTPVDGTPPAATTNSGATLTPPSGATYPTTTAGDEIVELYATGANGFSAGTEAATPTYNGTTAGVADSVQSQPGNIPSGSSATSSSSDNGVAQTIALEPVAMPTSITLTAPSGTATGSFVIASVTARGLTATGDICKPSTGSTWTAVGSTSTSGTGAASVTEATFWTTVSATTSYAFSFKTTSAGSCTAPAGATGIAVRYTGVSGVFDPSANGVVKTGSTAAPTAPSGGTSPVASTTVAGDEIAVFYGAGATTIGGVAVPDNGYVTASGFDDSSTDAPGANAIGAQTATEGTADNWTARTVALEPTLPTSLPFTSLPSNTVNGDFLLATITARGLGATGAICAAAGWTQIGSASNSNSTPAVAGASITEATFYNFYATGDSTTPQFTFETSSAGPCTASAGATGLMVRYTDVNTAQPYDPGTSPSNLMPASKTANGTTLTAPGTTSPTFLTTTNGDQIVEFYGTGAVTLGGTTNPETGTLTSSGIEDQAQATAGLAPATAQTATTTLADNWSARTIALEPVPLTSLTVPRPGTTPTSGDVVVVTVTARATSASGSGVICAPTTATDPDGDSWTFVPTTAGSTTEQTAGTAAAQITHATFWSIRSTSNSENYSFTFHTGSCAGGTIPDGASAAAAEFSGVDVVSPGPVDNNGDSGTASMATGLAVENVVSSTAVKANAVTTDYFNDEVIHTFGTAAGSLSGISGLTSAGVTGTYANATGLYDHGAAGVRGTSATATATAGSSTNGIGETLALVPSDGGCVAGGTSTGICEYGLEDPGGASTYYANSITQATTELGSGTGKDPGSRTSAHKVIILLSDGVANTYTSTPCQDAINNALTSEQSTTAPTIYTIAYGGYTDDCNDTTSIIPGLTVSSGTRMTGECALYLIANNPITDPAAFPGGLTAANMTAAQGKDCPSTAPSSDPGNHFYAEPSDSDLSSVFQDIGEALTEPRLVSNGAS